MQVPEGQRFRPFTRFYCVWVGITSTIDGIVTLLIPEFVSNGAYSWANTLFPSWVWGAVFLLIGVACLSQLIHPNLVLLRVSASIAIFPSFIFGLSILTLTLSGSYGALAGSTKWWAVSGMSVYLLNHPFTLPIGRPGDWWYKE